MRTPANRAPANRAPADRAPADRAPVKVPAWVVPALVVACAAAGVGSARLFAAPSVVRDYAPVPTGISSRTAVFVVEGVRCVDTAEAVARQLVDVPGALRLTAWASRAKVEVVFDPAAVSPAALAEALEGPVLDEATGEYRFGVYAVREIDGVRVDRRQR